MQFLLDTHTFLWFVNESDEIPEHLFNLLESDVDLLLSIASLWEIAIKVSINKLTLPKNYHEFISEQIKINDIEILPISLSHLNIITTLPLHHKDPFDRLIIAQAIEKNITIISKDSVFNSYTEIKTIW
ncbi:type II toxin-antitoxin system VapC family toxin [Geminocystis herdmanii]|uniref:type II toxin-antitoxin system VapC family toxin n=1 Tax=Geminocystis herdmanii TaxID=669359 RepID=UPI000349CF81|nr:type II toxin-antitoxin system VapC family toxin [Geminocystis herdmanii]